MGVSIRQIQIQLSLSPYFIIIFHISFVVPWSLRGLAGLENMLNVSPWQHTWKKTEQIVCLEGLPRLSPLFKKSMKAWQRLTKCHLNKPQDSWNNILWTDETKVEMSGLNPRSTVDPSCPLSSTVVEDWCFGVVEQLTYSYSENFGNSEVSGFCPHKVQKYSM